MKKLILICSLLFMTISYAQYKSSYTGAEIDAGIRPYKVYTALLTQEGTNAPVATVLENTIGDIVWTREDAGVYLATLANAFTDNKTMVQAYFSYFYNTQYIVEVISVNSISISTLGLLFTIEDNELVSEGLYADGYMLKVPIEIRVYP